MARIGVAFQAFFKALFDGEAAGRISDALGGAARIAQPAPAETPKAVAPPVPEKLARSEAVTLLAALQREARFIDFVQEPLTDLTDEQVGAAVREIHRNLAAAVERMFQPEAVLTDAEGSQVKIPEGFSAGRYRLIGQVSGTPPFQGTLAHHGWQVGQCQLPEWKGDDSAADIIAPAEVEIAS